MASYTQRGNRWRAQVRTGSTSISKTFKLKSDAEVWAKDMELKIERGGNVNFNALRETTVGDLMERYADEVSSKRNSWQFETRRLTAFRREPWARLTLDSNIAAALIAWRDRRLQTVKPASVVREFGLLGSVFTHAMTEWQLPLAANPAHMVKKPTVKGGERERLWTDRDLKIWMDYFQWSPDVAPDSMTMFIPWVLQIARKTGLRLGEVCRIETRHIDLSVPQIHFPTTKNGDAFDCPLRSDAVELISKLMAHRRGHELLVGASAQTIGQLYRVHRDIIATVVPEHKDIVIHSLRHTYTTEMVDRIPDKLALMRITGRRTLQSLARYYKPKAADLAKMMG